jgi:hypothetical protein
MMQRNSKDHSLESRQQALEKVKQHLAELKKRVGPLEELTPAEQDAFEAKFRNSVRMRRWTEGDLSVTTDTLVSGKMVEPSDIATVQGQSQFSKNRGYFTVGIVLLIFTALVSVLIFYAVD